MVFMTAKYQVETIIYASTRIVFNRIKEENKLNEINIFALYAIDFLQLVANKQNKKTDFK